MLTRLYAFRQTEATPEADHGRSAASARDPDGAILSGNPEHSRRSSRRYLRSSTLLSTELDALTSGATGSRELRQKRPRPESGHSSLDESDAKSDAHHAPKRHPKIEFRASQHPTAQNEASARTASFRLLVTPQTQRGCAARCEQAQPRRPSTRGRRRSGDLSNHGRRGIRTPEGEANRFTVCPR